MNEITLPVSELKSALPGFGKIIGRRSTLPVLGHIRLNRDSQGGVSLQATDLDSHAIYHVPELQEGAPVEVLVPFEPLNKLVRGLAGKEVVSFIPDGSNKLKIRHPLGGSSLEQKLDTVPADEFPSLPRISQPDIQMGPEFGVAIKQALQCCSQDASRPELCGVHVDVSDKTQHYIVASNGRALFSANSFAFDLPKSVLIPDSKFLNWTELMAAGCRLAFEPPAKGASQGFIRLASDRWTFLTRELEARFPHWKPGVPAMAFPKTVIKLPSPAVKQLLEVLPQLPGNEEVNRIVRLKHESGQFKVEGRSRESGWAGVFIPEAAITGQPVTLGLNRAFLLAALKFNLNEILIEDPVSALVCVNGGRKMVIMPVKLEFPPATRPAPDPQTTPTKIPDSQPAEERKTKMPETVKPQPAEAGSAREALDQIETVRGHLREALGGLARLAGLLKQVEKDKRSTEKEVASVRQTLRSLQGLKL